MYCPNCGQQLPDSTKFCINCGKALQIVQKQPTSNYQPVVTATPVAPPPINQVPVQPMPTRRKPWYKRWWIWVIVGVVITGLGASFGRRSDGSTLFSESKNVPIATTASATETPATQAPEPKEDNDSAPEPKEKEDTVPREYTNALRSAENYNSFMPMSKQALYDQLTSEYGDKFPPEAAQYAIDNIDADWKENAVKEAKNYLELFSMSKAELYDQLVSEYGGKYTPEEAQYAVDQVY